MYKETLKTKPSGEVNRSFKDSFSTFNLLTLIEKMKYKLTLFNGDLRSMVLLNRPGKQIVLTAFEKGTEISSFQENEQMILQVIWGKLKLHTHGESLIAGRGEIITVHEKTPYILTTGEKTVFLLTLISGNAGQTSI